MIFICCQPFVCGEKTWKTELLVEKFIILEQNGEKLDLYFMY